MKTAQELAYILETGSGLVRNQLLEAAAMLLQQAEQIEALTRERDDAYVQSLKFSEENKALKADVERFFILASTIKRDGYDWYIPDFFIPCESYDKRNEEPGMNAIRAAIDAMKGKS